MYGELVKELRDSAEWADRLALLMGRAEGDTHAPIMRNAADAIEELSHVAEVNTKRALKWASDAEKAEKKLRWIPVTERLPEMHENVLICNDDYGKTELGFSTVAVWDGSDWVNAWDGEGTICCVTHWMPLPEPRRASTRKEKASPCGVQDTSLQTPRKSRRLGVSRPGLPTSSGSTI